MSGARAASNGRSKRSPGTPADERARNVLPVRHWLFDFDNTIAILEPEVDWAASRRELEAALRESRVADDLIARIPRGNLLLYDALRERILGGRGAQAIPQAGAHAILTRASEIIEKYERAGVERAAPTPSAIELLRALHTGGTPIAIVTSNSSRTVGRWLELHRSTDVIGAVVGRDALLPLKPAPDMVVRALELHRIEAAGTALVGDSEADLIAARTAGVRFLGVCANPENRARLAAAGAADIFSSPAALGIYLNVLGGSARKRTRTKQAHRDGHRPHQ